MSLVTNRNTHIIASGATVINVQDFESLGFYLVGSGSGTITINKGTLDSAGSFIGSSAGTAPTTSVPLELAVLGFDYIQINQATAVTGNNGIYMVGQINKVSNE